MQNYKVLGIIPARAGSKRIPNKNKKKLNGKELIRYSIEAALQSQLLSTIVISSDDTDILNIASEYSNVITIHRPEEISGDQAPAITYVKHTLTTLNKAFDYIAIIQPTSPFTHSEDIDNTIRLLVDNQSADSAVSIMKLDHSIHPLKLKIKTDNHTLLPYLEEENGRMAAYELPKIYVRNGSVYVSKMDVIQKGQIIGNICLGYEMPSERSIDINNPIDFEFAEFLISKHGK